MWSHPELKRHGWLVVIGAVLAVILFLGMAAADGRPGFPLDDAWIHQTYARNLVRSGRWQYTPDFVEESNDISSGSTAPLWTLLLAFGYLLRLPYLFWSYLLGALSLAILALVGVRIWCLLWPASRNQAWLPGMTLVLSWQLVWGAASGMETIFYTALTLSVILLYLRYQSDGLHGSGDPTSADGGANGESSEGASSMRLLAFLGLVCGLLILTRPDGLIMLPLILIGLNLKPASLSRRFRVSAIFLAAAALPLLPYLVFNLRASGHVWPNTFYAKQAEYAQLLARPLLSRFSHLLFYSLGGPESGWQGSSGAHLFLLPGLFVAAWSALTKDWLNRRRNPRLHHTLPLLWAGGHILLYAWRLPVTYQHGRYLLATIPVWVIYGLSGWLSIVQRNESDRYGLLFKRVVGLSFAALLLIFDLLGAQAYATDVAFIEGEMVDVAYWLRDNTPPDALVASHDIGAIGYFAERPLLDLAGLLSPEIIPWLTDEEAMGNYIRDRGADYLVTAPGWPYANIARQASAAKVYASDFAWTREQGVNNMTVYQLLPR